MGKIRILHLTRPGFGTESIPIHTGSVSWSDAGANLEKRRRIPDLCIQARSARSMNSGRRNEKPHFIYTSFSQYFARTTFRTSRCHRKNHRGCNGLVRLGSAKCNRNREEHGTYESALRQYRSRRKLSV